MRQADHKVHVAVNERGIAGKGTTFTKVHAEAVAVSIFCYRDGRRW